MARTRQKKRVITVEPRELDMVVEDECGENHQSNQSPVPPEEPELEPSPPKKARVTRKTTTKAKVPRTTRASTKRTTASRVNLAKSESVPTPSPPKPSPKQIPRAVSTIPELIVTENLEDDSLLGDTQPLIKISRLRMSENLDRKSVTIVIPPSDPPTPEKQEFISSPPTQQSNESFESPDQSTEQLRNYMSPNDALTSSTIYATLGGTLSPQIEKDNLDDSSQQLTQRASSSYFNQNINDKSATNSAEPSINETTFGIIYYFLELPAEDENFDLMEKAYFCLMSRGYSTASITEKDINNLSEDEENGNFYFVLPEFEGTLFETLENHPRWRVISPIAILNFHDRHLPERDYPIMDVSMEQCFVTLSGLPKEDKMDLEEKIRQMSGQISSSLESQTTHIVASSWNTDKCLYTRRNGGYPMVMSPRWVDFHWDNIKIRSTSASDWSINKYYRLEVFTGFVICGANLSRSMSEYLRFLVMDNGGVYKHQLDPYRATHLVIMKKEGVEYERALDSERIKIVSPNWIHESISQGYPLPEQDASVRKLMNRMIAKMMDFVGAPFTSYTDCSPSKVHQSDHIKVPGSPEPIEEDTAHEMGSDED